MNHCTDCPVCGSPLYFGGKKSYETLGEHVFDPNSEEVLLRETLVCLNPSCIACHQYGDGNFWDLVEGSFFGRKYRVIPKIPIYDIWSCLMSTMGEEAFVSLYK